MSEFDRKKLSVLLASERCLTADNSELSRYLEYYGLAQLASSSDYRMECVDHQGDSLVSQSFRQRHQVQGSVVLLHGYMDHMGLYQSVIQYLFDNKYDVYCFDLTGHGLSSGDPLWVDDFKDYAEQLSHLLLHNHSYFRGEVSLIGQSTGAAIILAYDLLLPETLTTKKVIASGHRILLAPLVRPTLWRSIKRRFNVMKFLVKQVSRRYSRNSHNDQFVEFVCQQDPLQHSMIPVAWIGAMLAWGDWLEKQAVRQERVHILQGSEDRTVDWQHNLDVLSRVYPNTDITLLEGARHHLVNESEFYQQQVFSKLREILNSPVS